MKPEPGEVQFPSITDRERTEVDSWMDPNWGPGVMHPTHSDHKEWLAYRLLRDLQATEAERDKAKADMETHVYVANQIDHARNVIADRLDMARRTIETLQEQIKQCQMCRYLKEPGWKYKMMRKGSLLFLARTDFRSILIRVVNDGNPDFNTVGGWRSVFEIQEDSGAALDPLMLKLIWESLPDSQEIHE